MLSNRFGGRGGIGAFLAATLFILGSGVAVVSLRSGTGVAEVPQTMPPKLTPLVASGETVVGEKIAYPTGAPAKVTAAIVALPPGGETGWHRHGVPLFGYVLEGELTVDYGEKGVRVYRAGDAVLEAMTVAHNGRNTGAGNVRILAVYMGEDGAATGIPADGPDKKR